MSEHATQPVIVARGLTKRFGGLTAVEGAEFEVSAGECFGLLGPNGAGKTSTMRMITCTSPVTGGSLTVLGRDVRRDHRIIKASLGVVSQADSLDPDLSVVQNLRTYGRYFNLPGKTTEARAREALALFQLVDKADQKPDELSGGMRRRLLIARALLHEPKVLVLDEPTTGLDPQSRLLVWEKLTYLKSQGITILLTTHYMEEASYLCDRLVVMDRGRILVEGSPRDLIRGHVGDRVTEVRVGPSEKAGLLDILDGKGVEYEDRGDAVALYVDGSAAGGVVPGLDGYVVSTRPGNLEDVFLKLTGRGLREE